MSEPEQVSLLVIAALASIYLRHWAGEMNLTDLLDAALDDAGFIG